MCLIVSISFPCADLLDVCLLLLCLSSGAPGFSSENIYPDFFVHQCTAIQQVHLSFSALTSMFVETSVVNGCAVLFCSLLLRRECCSFSNGEYVKAGLAELELWCAKATTEVICFLCAWLALFYFID